jgi:hypothetical protein
MSTPEPGSRTTTAVINVLLLVLGILEGLIGSFQYSRSPVPLIAIILIVVLFVTCALGSWAMRSFASGLLVAVGWVVASFILSLGNSRGSVIITATSAGEWYLYGGVLAALAGVTFSFISWARAAGGASPTNRPRPTSRPRP